MYELTIILCSMHIDSTHALSLVLTNVKLGRMFDEPRGERECTGGGKEGARLCLNICQDKYK